MKKLGRPRLAARDLSKHGAWKRGQREMPSAPGMVRHHTRPGTYGSPTKGNTVLISRSKHAQIHNRLRRVKRRPVLKAPRPSAKFPAR